MSLQLVLFLMFLTASLVSTEKCTSSPGSSIDLSLSSLQNSSGHWIITVDTRRSTLAEDQRELTVNVHQESRLCGSSEIEQLVSITSVYPPLNDSTMAGPIQAITVSPTTTRKPNSCPHSGYQLFPGFGCYKAFPSKGEGENWRDAREVCRKDGGDLMVLETVREREEVYIPLYNSASFNSKPWMAVYIREGAGNWITVTGDPVPSSWWRPGFPDNNTAHRCATTLNQGLLKNWNCAALQSFICEIPL